MTKYIILTLLIGTATTANATPRCIAMLEAQACLKIEQSKPDSSRNGMTAPEYCAAQAIIKCE